jgi:hypothetical protein
MTVGYGLSNEMFDTQRINFHTFEGNKNGSPKEHKFRVLPAYAPGKLFHKVGLHWGFRTVDGKMKAITCSLEEKGSCPICDRINALKGQKETIEAALTTEYDPQKRASLEEQLKQIEEYVSDHRRKPMYLWNIMTEEGDQKVLQLSWNGHDPLFEKIKFIFSQQKIDVTSIENSQLMYCNRSGVKAKTRYQYEMLGDYTKKLELTKLTDLSKVYVAKDLNYLQQVIETGMVPADKEDPNDRNFDTQQMPGMMPPQNIQTNIPTQAGMADTAPTTIANTQMGNQHAPTIAQQPTVNTQQPVETVQTQTTAVPSNPQPQLNLTEEQDKNVAEMMAALHN